MSARQKWLPDLRRNRARRVSRTALDAGVPFDLFHQDLGPRTIETADEVENLLEGLEVPLRTLVRDDDPQSSVLAAVRVRKGASFLEEAVRRTVGTSRVPMSAFDIAETLLRETDRWSESTIRSAVSRSGLRCVDIEGRSPRGQKCARYVTPDGYKP